MTYRQRRKRGEKRRRDERKDRKERTKEEEEEDRQKVPIIKNPKASVFVFGICGDGGKS